MVWRGGNGDEYVHIHVPFANSKATLRIVWSPSFNVAVLGSSATGERKVGILYRDDFNLFSTQDPATTRRTSKMSQGRNPQALAQKTVIIGQNAWRTPNLTDIIACHCKTMALMMSANALRCPSVFKGVRQCNPRLAASQPRRNVVRAASDSDNPPATRSIDDVSYLSAPQAPAPPPSVPISMRPLAWPTLPPRIHPQHIGLRSHSPVVLLQTLSALDFLTTPPEAKRVRGAICAI